LKLLLDSLRLPLVKAYGRPQLFEGRLVQAARESGRQFRLQLLPQRVDVRDARPLEEKQVAQQVDRLLARKCCHEGTATRSSASPDEALGLQRLHRFAHCPLGRLQELLREPFWR